MNEETRVKKWEMGWGMNHKILIILDSRSLIYPFIWMNKLMNERMNQLANKC